ncbi:MAG: hypothetical protein WC662_00230 [Candidatus Paceibacterota bacterium]|jgi:hypothetical protein
MNKNTKTIIISIIIIVLFFCAVYFLNKKNTAVSQDVNLNNSNDSYNEFEILFKKASPIKEIETKTEITKDGYKICDLLENPSCLDIKSDFKPVDQKETHITFINKPIEGNLYIYPVVGDMSLIVEYTNGGWSFPKIKYLENAEMQIVKLENKNNAPYRIFEREEADGGSAYSTYMIDPTIENFPYWIKFGFNINVDDFNLNQDKNRDFIQNLNIIKN